MREKEVSLVSHQVLNRYLLDPKDDLGLTYVFLNNRPNSFKIVFTVAPVAARLHQYSDARGGELGYLCGSK